MKKKFFATLALFASMALTACGGTTTNSESKAPEASSGTPAQSADQSSAPAQSSAGGASKSSKHTHTAADDAPWQNDENRHWKECKDGDGGKVDSKAHSFEADTTDPENKAATCKETGVKVEVCSVCGYRKVSDVAKLEHTFDDGVASGNCGEAGKITYTCQVCGETKEEVSGYIQHSWTKTGSVEASGDGLAYDLVKCTKCEKEGLMVAVAGSDIVFTSSDSSKQSLKTAPDGCVKLPANGDNFTVKINLPEAKYGKLFMRGSMDYWYTENNKNEEKGIYNGQSNGTASKEAGIANFKMEVGQSADSLEQVALTADKDLLYKDFLPEEPGFTGVADTDWSQIGDVEVGNVSLAAGLNLIKFTRVDSYNLAIHDFVIAFENVA